MTGLAAAEAGYQNAGIVQRRERIGLPLFLLLLFAISWVGALPMILASRGVEMPAPLKLLQVLMLFGPALAAGFTAYINEGRAGLKRLFQGLLRWRNHPLLYAAVLAGPALLFAAALGISKAAGFTAAPFPSLVKFLSTFGITLGVYVLLNTEEVAWRGYVLPRLQSRMGVLPATAVIAILWLVFHLPLFWVQGGHPAGYPFWLFSLLILAISLPFTSVYNATGGSILMAHLLHQSFNAAVEAIPLYPVVTHSLIPTGVSVVLCAAVTVILVIRGSGGSAAAR